MSVYFDASVIVSLFVQDAHTPRVNAWLAKFQPEASVSSWAAAEVSSALAIRVRAGGAEPTERAGAERGFDNWLQSGVRWIEPVPADFLHARQMIRQDAVVLRTPDALQAAIAYRLGLEFATLDGRLAQACRSLGLPVAPI